MSVLRPQNEQVTTMSFASIAMPLLLNSGHSPRTVRTQAAVGDTAPTDIINATPYFAIP
jgi:hypothetical protein